MRLYSEKKIFSQEIQIWAAESFWWVGQFYLFFFLDPVYPSLKTRAENQKFLVVKGIIDYSCVLFDKSWALLQELSSKLFSSVFYSSLLLLTALIRLVGGTSQLIVSPCLFEVSLFQQSPSPSSQIIWCWVHLSHCFLNSSSSNHQTHNRMRRTNIINKRPIELTSLTFIVIIRRVWQLFVDNKIPFRKQKLSYLYSTVRYNFPSEPASSLLSVADSSFH